MTKFILHLNPSKKHATWALWYGYDRVVGGTPGDSPPIERLIDAIDIDPNDYTLPCYLRVVTWDFAEYAEFRSVIIL